VDAEGRCRYPLLSGRDVTDGARALRLLNESEAKFARSFQSSPAAMSITRLRDGRFLDVNDACCRLWGYTREEFIGKTAVELRLWQRPADRDEFFRLFGATGSVRDLEILVRTRYDERRTVLFSAERAEAAGEPCMVAGIRDETSKREAERVQREMEAQLRQAQKLEALGTLAGGIAHDFNNILSAIIGVTDLVEMDAQFPDAIRGHVGELRGASDRARTLVHQILSFSRREPERRVFDVRGVIDDAVRLLHRGVPPSLVIETRLPAKPVMVNADPNQIHQVLMNLGTNAAHAMRSSSGTIDIALDQLTTDAGLLTTVPMLGPGSYARITVADTGKGMDEETARRIFEPFFTTKQPGEGTGLGLAVVHGILSEHAGALGVDSQLSKGTRMVVHLPLHDGREGKAAEVSRPSTLCGHGERVMVVDDETSVGRTYATLLSRIGYDVTVFDNAPDALARFAEAPDRFDLVLTDVAMPNMTGTELARAILERRPGMPILLCTGYAAGLSREDASYQDIRDVLQKPVTLDALAEAVVRALAGASGPANDGRPR
jgi:two-component system cell cycle sensor histidine kinase/response regulator CckA